MRTWIFVLIGLMIENHMAKKIMLPELKKYDVTQRVLEMLADAESRSILFSVIRTGRTANELSIRHKIPLSSVYKKISDLEELSLIKVDKLEISDSGRKYKVYKSRIKQAEIIIKNPEPRLDLLANNR